MISFYRVKYRIYSEAPCPTARAERDIWTVDKHKKKNRVNGLFISASSLKIVLEQKNNQSAALFAQAQDYLLIFIFFTFPIFGVPIGLFAGDLNVL